MEILCLQPRILKVFPRSLNRTILETKYNFFLQNFKNTKLHSRSAEQEGRTCFKALLNNYSSLKQQWCCCIFVHDRRIVSSIREDIFFPIGILYAFFDWNSWIWERWIFHVSKINCQCNPWRNYIGILIEKAADFALW